MSKSFGLYVFSWIVEDLTPMNGFSSIPASFGISGGKANSVGIFVLLTECEPEEKRTL